MTEQERAKTVYVNEAEILPAVDEWLAGLFAIDKIEDTPALLPR